MEDTSFYGVELLGVTGVVRTGIIDEEEMDQLIGPDAAEHIEGPVIQARFEGVVGTTHRLFEASANLCLEFESKANATLAAAPPQPGETGAVRLTAAEPETRVPPEPAEVPLAPDTTLRTRRGRNNTPTAEQIAAAEVMVEKERHVDIQHAS